MNNNLYVWVDLELNLIASLPQEIPKNWKNINGLNNLDDATLKQFGWYKINDPDLLNFNYNQEWIQEVKDQILDNIANQRWNAQTEHIKYKGNFYILNDQTINSLYQKRLIVENDPDLTFAWKTRDSIIQLSSSELVELTNLISSYIQQCFDIEKQFVENFPLSNTLEDFINLDLSITWPSIELN